MGAHLTIEEYIKKRARKLKLMASFNSIGNSAKVWKCSNCGRINDNNFHCNECGYFKFWLR